MQLQFGVLPTLSGEEYPFQIGLLGGVSENPDAVIRIPDINSQANDCVNACM